jgi:hypothetical protein
MSIDAVPFATAARPGARRARPGPFADGPLTARERAAAAMLLAVAGALVLVVTATAVAIVLGPILELQGAFELR